MSKQKKVLSLNEINSVYSDLNSVLIVHYHGLTVDSIQSLRKSLKGADATFKVVKNTIARIATVNSNIEGSPKIYFKGPVAISYSKDPVSQAKIICDFAKENEHMKIVGCVFENKLFGPETVKKLSLLPSLDTARAQIAMLISTPATNIARIISEPLLRIARLSQLYSKRDGKE